MRIMVLGATGQLGRHLCAQLGGDAIAITRDELDFSSPTYSEIFAELLGKHVPNAVINAAAYTNVAGAEEDEDNAVLCNATVPAVLAEHCHKSGVGFVHGSTDYVFDGEKRSPYLESDRAAPMNAYGRSKLAGENAVRAMHPEALVLRYSWLYDAVGSGFFSTIRKLANQQPSLRIVADQIGTPTYAADAASMTLDVLRMKPDGGVYHVASGGHTSWHGFACHAVDDDTVLEPILASEYAASVPRPADSRLGTSTITAMGIQVPHWRDGIVRCKENLSANS